MPRHYVTAHRNVRLCRLVSPDLASRSFTQNELRSRGICIQTVGMSSANTTPASEVLAVVEWLSTHGTIYQINGGWAVDALVGRQTREHGDLDVFVDANSVPSLLAWLGDRGYTIVEDWLPIRIELASPLGRVDVHPMTIASNGDGTQRGFGDETFLHTAAERTTGTIDGHPVIVACQARLRQLREGYELRPEDHHDLGLLARLGTETQPKS